MGGRENRQNRNPTAMERLEWETLRTEMTIAEINVERQLMENPEDDETSSDEEVENGGVARATFAATTVVMQTQEELDFYKSLIMPTSKVEESSGSESKGGSTTTKAPLSPLVRAMMSSMGDSDEDGVDDMNDERWLAIDQSGEYMQEYERELRKELQGEL